MGRRDEGSPLGEGVDARYSMNWLALTVARRAQTASRLTIRVELLAVASLAMIAGRIWGIPLTPFSGDFSISVFSTCGALLLVATRHPVY